MTSDWDILSYACSFWPSPAPSPSLFLPLTDTDAILPQPSSPRFASYVNALHNSPGTLILITLSSWQSSFSSIKIVSSSTISSLTPYSNSSPSNLPPFPYNSLPPWSSSRVKGDPPTIQIFFTTSFSFVLSVWEIVLSLKLKEAFRLDIASVKRSLIFCKVNWLASTTSPFIIIRQRMSATKSDVSDVWEVAVQDRELLLQENFF